MPVQLSQLADFSIAECIGDFTVTQVADIYPQFKSLIDSAPLNLMVDLSQLEDFDSSALQLLLWLKAHLPSDCELQFIVADNDVVTRVLNLYHLSEQLISTHASFLQEAS